jgi:deoxycytidylate deaminase
MNHVEMMRLAERCAQNSDCADRKVGAVVVLAEGGAISASNTAAWDDTNDNHAESKLIIMVELMRKSLEGATLYTTCRPCARCTAILLGRGIKAIYYRDRQPEMGHLQELVKDGVYLNSGWITGRVAESWAERNGVAG